MEKQIFHEEFSDNRTIMWQIYILFRILRNSEYNHSITCGKIVKWRKSRKFIKKKLTWPGGGGPPNLIGGPVGGPDIGGGPDVGGNPLGGGPPVNQINNF